MAELVSRQRLDLPSNQLVVLIAQLKSSSQKVPIYESPPTGRQTLSFGNFEQTSEVVLRAKMQLTTIRPTLLNLNRSLLVMSTYMIGLESELGVPEYKWLRQVQNLLLIWTLAIYITSGIKFSKVLSVGLEVEKRTQVDWGDLLTLDYMQNMNNFGRLQYSLIFACTSASILWRLHLRHFRSKARDGRVFWPQRELFGFCLNGPTQLEASSDTANLAKKKEAHNKQLKRCSTGQVDFEPKVVDYCNLFPIQTYTNRIGAGDFFNDHSTDRWMFLFKWNIIGLIALLVSGLFLTIPQISGVYEIIDRFEIKNDRSFLGTFLSVYGRIEIAYLFIQVWIFLGFSSYIINIFTTDLIFKSQGIKKSLLRQIQLQNRGKKVRNFRPEILRQQQLVIAYFDSLQNYDKCFVSKYCYALISSILLNSCFTLSYYSTPNERLQFGSKISMLSVFISATYPHLMSMCLLLNTESLFKMILQTQAREKSISIKRAWLSILDAYFGSGSSKTFTSGHRPLNLVSYILVSKFNCFQHVVQLTAN